MSVDSAISAGRAAAEARMLDTCRITKPGDGEGAWNSATGSYDPPASVTVYEGPCRMKDAAATPSSTASAGAEVWAIAEPVLYLPVVGSEDVGATDQTVEYLTSAYDAAQVGRKFGFVGGTPGSQTTARRLRVKEAVGT